MCSCFGWVRMSISWYLNPTQWHLVLGNKKKLVFSRLAPAMLRQASYGTIKIGTYQSLKRLLVDRPEGESQFPYFCDTYIRTRWWAVPPKPSARAHSSQVTFPEKCACLLITVFWTVHSCLKQRKETASLSSPISDETLLTNVVCGVLSGVISSSIANPTDVLKVAVCTSCCS